MRLNFACLIFVARDDNENILTAKISRFTVYTIVQSRKICMRLASCFMRSQSSPYVFLKGVGEECVLGTVTSHIKAFNQPTQRSKEISV